MMKNNAKPGLYKDYNDTIILTQGTNVIISKTKIKGHLLLYIKKRLLQIIALLVILSMYVFTNPSTTDKT